jgi:hypothetical protein
MRLAALSFHFRQSHEFPFRNTLGVSTSTTKSDLSSKLERMSLVVEVIVVDALALQWRWAIVSALRVATKLTFVNKKPGNGQ